MIAKCALDFATQGNEVIVVSDDTDVLVLLAYHWKMNMSTIYFKQNAKKMAWTLLKILVNCLHHIILYSLSMHGVVLLPHLPRMDKAKHFYLKSLAKSLKS